MITELLILVEGVVMGRVFEQTKRGGTLSFQYDPAWLALKDAFPLSVSMPLSEAPYRQRAIKTFLAKLMLKHVKERQKSFGGGTQALNH